MATSVLPAVLDALVTQARAALPDVQVYDGYGLTDDPTRDYLMVGVEDPDSDQAAAAGQSRQQWANAGGTSRDEEGEVTCAAVSWNGDGDQAAARAAAFATCAAVEQVCRDTPSLGVPGVLWTGYGSETNLTQDLFDDEAGAGGALAMVVFRVFFRARI